MEEALERATEPDDPRAILCHRGSLDPLAYWLNNGWAEADSWSYTRTPREEHYRSYKGVIHLVTAADGASQAYQRWPHAHRPELPEAAIRLDCLLDRIWKDHPGYVRIDNRHIDGRRKLHSRRVSSAKCSGQQAK